MAVHTARSSSSLSSEHSNLISTTTPPPHTTSSSPTRWFRRYKFFFIFVFLFLILQIFLAYKSFNIPLFNNNSNNNDNNNFISINSNLIDINNNNNNNYNKHKNSNNKKSELIIDDEDIHSNSNLYSLNNNNSNNSNNNNNNKKSTNNKNDDLKLNFVPKCNIHTKEAISAIYRSKTDNCKKLIVNITCDIQNHTFYPKHLHSLCPNDKKYRKNHLIGCFKDEKNYRILSGYYINFKLNNSPEKCIQLCLQSGFVYAGVQYSTECFCGNDAPPVAAKLADPSCNMKCPGDPKEACGGYFTVNIYETGIAKFTAQIAEVTPKPIDEPVRIAFLLTLNGRALRQIHRLIKNLYNPRHYYFIHVDARQDYLYRELLPLELRYKNIKLARTRFSTIWGGASLLTMLLSSMEYLLASTKWQWNFVINLSESDFPVKSIDKLSTFLTANKGKNFVKSHGREVQRFIQKQGLDKTFVECDTHMWRIGDRELPYGIQIDGGSDWIALSREFVIYLTDSKRDELINGLLIVFRHTLLPAESFFHTVLRNSKFCNTYIDNNLHVTNWKRRLGCKCQYKHVVDWCGCSPNDFKPEDWNRLQATEAKHLFFARKFEPIVNQNIILQLEEWIYGPYPNDYINLNNYWQSIYHHKDKSPPPDDSLLTIVTSLIRINSVSYNYIPNNILEVTSHFENDHYKGFLILHECYFENNRKYMIETLVKPNQIAKTSISSHIGKRIRMLEVSTEYDQKEQITRNFGKMLGPNSEPVLIFRLSAASTTPAETNLNYNVSILWIDPTGNLANVDEYHIEDGQASSMNFIKSSLHQPLTPGVWTAKILNSKNIIGSCRFLVTPLQFVNKIEITSAYGEKFNYGYKYDKYNTHDQVEYKNYLIAVEDREIFKQKSLADSKRIGLDLQIWIDNLVANFYTIKKSCIYNSNSSSKNNNNSNSDSKDKLDKSILDKKIEICQETTWSTFALDPKSDVSDLNKT